MRLDFKDIKSSIRKNLLSILFKLQVYFPWEIKA